MKEEDPVKTLPWGKGVRIAKVDANGLMAIDKPPGLLSHPNRKGDTGRSLLRASYDFEKQAYRIPSESSEASLIYLLNRLDSATSGLLLMTASRAIRDQVLEAFERKRVCKVYEALVFGIARKGKGEIWRDRLAVSKAEGGVRAVAGGSLRAETQLLASRPIPGMPSMSLLRLSPLTGRTHQLRIQAAKRGLPIVGDRTYGDFNKNKLVARSKGIKRLCLHCTETSVDYEMNGQTYKFAARSKTPF